MRGVKENLEEKMVARIPRGGVESTDKAREFDLFGLNKYSMRTFSLFTAYNRFHYPDVYLLSLNPWRCVENKSLHT